MKKLKSFGAALILFVAFALCVNGVCAHSTLKMDHETFRYWFDPYKDMSYDALSRNLEKDTVLLMGSSEFRYGRKSTYHPQNLFAGTNMDLLTIGGAWNQILFHTIALGALEQDLQSRKVILLVSPTWFRKQGVRPEGYAARFSETEYFNFMTNEHIPLEIRKYAARRSEKLLLKYPDKAGYVKLINRTVLIEKENRLLQFVTGLRTYLAKGRDHAAVMMAMQFMKKEEQEKNAGKAVKGRADPGAAKALDTAAPSKQDWNRLLDRAIRSAGKRSSNPFFMTDKKWKKKYSQFYHNKRMRYIQRIHPESREFDDLEAFLEICRTNRIRAKLIVLPVNGRWYDHIGTKRDIRRETTRKICQLAQAYGAEAVDLTKYEYEEFITMDAQHPWSAGWVLINEEIYRFCHKEKSS